MVCSACQSPNPGGAKFCNACGNALPVACGTCAHENPSGARFCNACGSALPSDGPAPSGPDAGRLRAGADPLSYTPKYLADRILRQKTAIEGERRHVTVLFSDLVDSTAFAEQVGDPEEVHRLLDAAFRIVLDQVHRYEGTVNLFTGDGAMVLFGAPIALEDAPRRAITAALAIQRGLEALDAEVQARHGLRFRMRIGIHSGHVVVATIGDDLRMDYTAVGDTTNLAARLEAQAPAGGILVSDATRKLAEGFFDFTPVPPMHLKGVSGLVRAHRVVSARPVDTRIDAVTRGGEGLTAYVGRDRELDALMTAYETARAGHGQVVFVVGEAGIGKSRLLHEFHELMDEREHVWLEGRCASFARATPFYAVADFVRRAAGIDDRDGEEQALEKLDRAELREDFAWTLPYLRVLLSLPSGSDRIDTVDPMSLRAEMSRALHNRIIATSQETPVIMVVEDLHWVDAATQEFLVYMADTLAAARVLMILTHRPGYVHPFGDRSFHVRVPLQPLSEEAMCAMAGSVLETTDLPPSLRRLIAAKAEGNPLFVEELTTSLLEEGVLTLQGGRVRLARDLSDVAVPDRIQDVLMARLDRLPDEPKRAIQMASVIGREFAMRLLERIHDAAAGLDGVIGELRALELIYEKAAHPELAYMFKHALTHEVAYESLLFARRKSLHRLVGTAIEELYGDRLTEHYEALAHHFAEAADHTRAAYYHRLAAAKAAKTYANHAAIEQANKALEQAALCGETDPETLFELYNRIGECAWMTSEFHKSGEGFARAADLSPENASILHARAATSYLWDHDYERCKAHIARSLELVGESSDAAAAEAYALFTRDEFDLIHGRTLDDDTTVNQCIALAERSNRRDVLVATLGQRVQRLQWRGEYESAIGDGERAVALAAEHAMPGTALFGTWFLGIAYICVGRYQRGFEVLEGASAVCERIGDRAIQARLHNTLGWAYGEIGCYDRAMHYNRVSTEMGRELVDLRLVAGAPELYANGAINLAGNLLSMGRVEEAADQLGPIQAQADEDPDPWMRWRWSTHLLHQQARLALARNDIDAALAVSERECAAARATRAQKLIGRAHEMRGRILLKGDDRDSARSELDLALSAAEQIGQPTLILRARGMLAELASRNGDTNAAAAQRTAMKARIDLHIHELVADDARRQYSALGERYLDDPFGAYR